MALLWLSDQVGRQPKGKKSVALSMVLKKKDLWSTQSWPFAGPCSSPSVPQVLLFPLRDHSNFIALRYQ